MLVNNNIPASSTTHTTLNTAVEVLTTPPRTSFVDGAGTIARIGTTVGLLVTAPVTGPLGPVVATAAGIAAEQLATAVGNQISYYFYPLTREEQEALQLANENASLPVGPMVSTSAGWFAAISLGGVLPPGLNQIVVAGSSCVLSSTTRILTQNVFNRVTGRENQPIEVLPAVRDTTLVVATTSLHLPPPAQTVVHSITNFVYRTLWPSGQPPAAPTPPPEASLN